MKRSRTPPATPPCARSCASSRRKVTSFDGSLSSAVAALVDGEGGKLSAEELQRIEAIIKAARDRSK
jgi:hypothetical protein